MHLHNKRRAQVNKIGIANVGEQGIWKAFGVLFQQFVKFGFPEKVNKVFQRRDWFYPVVIVFKMICMKKLDVLQEGSLEC